MKHHFIKSGWILLIIAFLAGPGCNKKSSPPPRTASPPPSVPGFDYLEQKRFTCRGTSHKIHLYRHKQTGIEFSLLPAGMFQIGSPAGEEGREESEGPLTRVHMKSFLISRKEITQGEWKKIMNSEPWKNQDQVKGGNNYPAVYISWSEGQKFCKKLGGDLPTEAQWEYACRAGNSTAYYWGKNVDMDYAWYRDNAWKVGSRHPQVVGGKKPNAFGLYDMAGNVHEWCRDKWQPHLRGITAAGRMDGSDNRRVVRGGSWSNLPRHLRSASRASMGSSLITPLHGFRCVLSVSKEKSK